jgi:hypothetical protein
LFSYPDKIQKNIENNIQEENTDEIEYVEKNLKNASESESDLKKNVKNENEKNLKIQSSSDIYGDLQNLRKKYDAVVEYTVHLTAERGTYFRTYMNVY